MANELRMQPDQVRALIAVVAQAAADMEPVAQAIAATQSAVRDPQGLAAQGLELGYAAATHERQLVADAQQLARDAEATVQAFEQADATDLGIPAVSGAVAGTAAATGGISPTPIDPATAAAQQYLHRVQQIMARAARGELSNADVDAALQALPCPTGEADAAVWRLLEAQYHADAARALHETDLYRQYRAQPTTTPLSHVVASAVAFGQYATGSLGAEGSAALPSYAQLWAEHVRHQALDIAVQDVYWTELVRLDDVAEQRPLTEAEVLRRADLGAQLGLEVDWETRRARRWDGRTRGAATQALEVSP